MSNKFKEILKIVSVFLQQLGLNPRKILSLKYYQRYRKDKKEWIRKKGKITNSQMVLHDYEDNAGSAKGHYFHQDLLVAKLIYENQPRRHIDVASRIDGFVAHVASFREVEVVDIRPLERSKHKNINFVQADLMNPQNLGETDSLSCLHAIEHFGLGRYNDPIEVDGHLKGIDNLIKLVSNGGYL